MLDATGEPFVTSVERTGLFPCPEMATLEEYLQLFVNRGVALTQIQDVFLDKGITALLSPGAPHVALPHDMYRQ
jgi:hypothetical protein